MWIIIWEIIKIAVSMCLSSYGAFVVDWRCADDDDSWMALEEITKIRWTRTEAIFMIACLTTFIRLDQCLEFDECLASLEKQRAASKNKISCYLRAKQCGRCSELLCSIELYIYSRKNDYESPNSWQSKSKWAISSPIYCKQFRFYFHSLSLFFGLAHDWHSSIPPSIALER